MTSVGSEIAGYRIDGILGRGGMGVVYEATQVSLARKVALKLIVPELGQDVALKERFRREGLRQAALEHPNILPVYEAGETEEGLFFAMRLVRGPTLKHMIVSEQLDARRAMRILGAVADALDSAHDAGIVHRDIKPQNILIGNRDHAYLADFGLTKTVGDRSLTRSGHFVGTIDYVSPEQIRGEPATPRSDVYSLAAVLFECLTGVVPYRRESEAAVLYAHLFVAPPQVSGQRRELPARLDGVIERAMAKDAEDRYATAGEMLRAAEDAFSRPSRATDEAPMRPPAAVPAPPTKAAATVPLAEAEDALAGTASRVRQDGEARPTPSHERSGTAPAVPEPARDSVKRRPAARSVLPVAAVTTVLVAAVGYMLGGAGGSDAQTTAAAGPLRIELPANWHRTSTVPQVPGLTLRDAVSYERADGADASLLAGTSGGTGATLLPASFESRLERAPRTDDIVQLGDMTAYRYEELAVRGLQVPLTMFVGPLPNRVATVVCIGSPQIAATRECEEAASTLRLVEAEALPLGAREEYAEALGAALRRLDARRRSGRRSLRRAETLRGRATPADNVADAYAAAARSLARVPAGPAERPLTRDLVTQARIVEAAYRRLASAARGGDRGRYPAAVRAVRKTEERTHRLLDRLGRLGYRVR